MVSAIWSYAFINQVVFGDTTGSRPASDMELCLIGLLIILPVWSIFWKLKLTTTIDQNTITIRLNPFSSKIINILDIVDFKVIQYDFVGFGLRLCTKYGTVYNCNGNQGVFFQLKDGKSILLGSQEPEDIINYLHNIQT